jgi:2-keto-4-pentenoate hydratase
VTTGSWTGKLYAMAGDSVEVTFAHFGKVAISFE